MINRLKKSKAGFTLIELMIVVAIIGILSAIAIPNYLSYRAKGQDATAKSEARNFYTTALAEVADTGLAYDLSGGFLPVGFTENPDITRVGSFTITVTGVVTSGLTFKYGDNGTSFDLNFDGSITPTVIVG